MKNKSTYPIQFATMLRGLAARLESGDLFLLKAEHDMSIDPRANQSVSFVVSPVPLADPPAPTETEPLRRGIYATVTGVSLRHGERVKLLDYSAIDGKWYVEHFSGKVFRYPPSDLAPESAIEGQGTPEPLPIGTVFPNDLTLRDPTFKARVEATRVPQGAPSLRQPPERCGIARENTGGTYYCSREPGHDGPCASWASSGAKSGARTER